MKSLRGQRFSAACKCWPAHVSRPWTTRPERFFSAPRSTSDIEALITASDIKDRPLTFDTEEFRVKPGSRLDLHQWPTRVPPGYESKRDYARQLAAHAALLSERQGLIDAGKQHALLLIFQGMDAAGKDGIIKHVMSGINPQGCQVFSFKQPSAQELAHDFLWRAASRLPERGCIGIFNRSYYEEVLIVRVHPELLQAQSLPPALLEQPDFWPQRLASITDFERHMTANGTHIVKFFLHLSKKEQRQRLLDRLDEPSKTWKFSRADIAERSYWNAYMDAYAQALSATSTEQAPWYVVPADDKENARLIVSQVLTEIVSALPLAYPAPMLSAKELAQIRRKLGA